MVETNIHQEIKDCKGVINWEKNIFFLDCQRNLSYRDQLILNINKTIQSLCLNPESELNHIVVVRMAKKGSCE